MFRRWLAPLAIGMGLGEQKNGEEETNAEPGQAGKSFTKLNKKTLDHVTMTTIPPTLILVTLSAQPAKAQAISMIDSSWQI